jgi:isopenicillin N synthase-like dioxygenase
MQLDIISLQALRDPTQLDAHAAMEQALLNKGIVGISGVPYFLEKSRAFVKAALEFSQLPEAIKESYQPDRDSGDTEGYECGAERFKDPQGVWHVDDKKVSYYAWIPDEPRNIWPLEIDLKSSYLALGELIFQTGKVLLNVMGLNESIGIHHDRMKGHGRMLHYRKESDLTNINPNWCGGHFDHSLFTGLMPGYYFRDGVECPEPEEAGLNIDFRDGRGFQKVSVPDQSIMLFQVGELGQLVSNDRIRATKHLVTKSLGGIERIALALFWNIDPAYQITSTSELTQDSRFSENRSPEGYVTAAKWAEMSYARYLATQKSA